MKIHLTSGMAGLMLAALCGPPALAQYVDDVPANLRPYCRQIVVQDFLSRRVVWECPPNVTGALTPFADQDSNFDAGGARIGSGVSGGFVGAPTAGRNVNVGSGPGRANNPGGSGATGGTGSNIGSGGAGGNAGGAPGGSTGSGGISIDGRVGDVSGSVNVDGRASRSVSVDGRIGDSIRGSVDTSAGKHGFGNSINGRVGDITGSINIDASGGVSVNGRIGDSISGSVEASGTARSNH